MKRYFEQLTPQERRIVVGAGLFVFLLLNYFFVWGHYGEWGREVARMNLAEKKLKEWGSEVRNQPVYERKIKLFEEGGGPASTDDPGIDIIRFYNERAVENQVSVVTGNRPTVRTNSPYLIERELNVQVRANETHLVNFLYSLGSGNSAVRVKSMTLRPDGAHQELNASLTIVASYQTKPPTKSRTPAAGSASCRQTRLPPRRAREPARNRSPRVLRRLRPKPPARPSASRDFWTAWKVSSAGSPRQPVRPPIFPHPPSRSPAHTPTGNPQPLNHSENHLSHPAFDRRQPPGSNARRQQRR